MYNLHEAYLDVYEEDDKRRAPKELLDRLSREGWMAQDGPNRRVYEARQRLLRKAWEKRNQKEELDIYDIVLSYLLDEGYVDTEHAAKKIISVMSEEWIDNIFEVLSPEEKAKRRAASQARRQALGIPEKTPEETAEIMGRVRQRGARTRGQVPASSSLNVAPVSVGRQTIAQNRAGAQADKILSSPDNRTTSTGAPTATPTYINANGERKTLASSGGTLTYTMRKVNPGQRPSQQVRDFTGDITNRNLQLRKSPNER